MAFSAPWRLKNSRLILRNGTRFGEIRFEVPLETVLAMKYRKGREIGLVRDNRCSPLGFEEFFQLQELLFVQLPTCPGYEERRPDSDYEEEGDKDNR